MHVDAQQRKLLSSSQNRTTSVSTSKEGVETVKTQPRYRDQSSDQKPNSPISLPCRSSQPWSKGHVWFPQP
jgi:hypothetical protein